EAANKLAKRFGAYAGIIQDIAIIKGPLFVCQVLHSVKNISFDEIRASKDSDWSRWLEEEIPQDAGLGVVHEPHDIAAGIARQGDHGVRQLQKASCAGWDASV